MAMVILPLGSVKLGTGDSNTWIFQNRYVVKSEIAKEILPANVVHFMSLKRRLGTNHLKEYALSIWCNDRLFLFERENSKVSLLSIWRDNSGQHFVHNQVPCLFYFLSDTNLLHLCRV